MSRNLFLVVTLSLLSASTTLLSTPVRAEVPLKFADIQAMLRQVRLLPKNKLARPAQIGERMFTGDALSTARSSKADLRFNDGSFARVGELALFRFTPNTRQFNLSNGTALLLIPPGRGTTTVKTPNVSAGIRGSALFVRVDEQTGTTIVGALTNSGITVTDNVTNRLVELQAGQMAVADPRGLRLFDFDLTTFYQTSNIVRGLNLEQKPSETSSDKDIAAVQGETSEAVGKQEKIPDEAVAKNLDFIKLSPQPSGSSEEKIAVPLPTNLPTVGKVAPDIFDRGTLGTGQPTSSNPEIPKLKLPSSPSTPPVFPVRQPVVAQPPVPSPQPGSGLTPIPRELPAVKAPEPSPAPVLSPQPGSGLTPIPRELPAVKAPEPSSVPVFPTPTPAPVPPTVTPTPGTAPVPPIVNVTPAPVVVPISPPTYVTPPVQVTPAPVIPSIQITPPANVNPPIQLTPAPVIPPVQVTPPIQVTPAPVIAPVRLPINVTPPVVTPAPVAAPVIPLPMEVIPKAPAAIQSVPSPTPNAVPTVPTNNPSSSPVSPTPTLAPSLAPTIAPVLPLDGRSVPAQNQPATSGT